MRLTIDTTHKVFQVADDPVPKLDGAKKQRTAGRDGLPLWVVQLLCRDEDGGSVINVNVASAEIPDVEPGDDVDVLGLWARPWESRGKQGMSFVASHIILRKD